MGQSTIARWLQSRGHSILPMYEKELDNGKGPRMFAPDREIITPDLLAIRAGNALWIECKHKKHFTWHRLTQRWTTGIDRYHYDEYLEIQRRYPWKIYLLFLHRERLPAFSDRLKSLATGGCPVTCPTGLFGGELRYLSANINHTSGKWGKGGMVYWSAETLSLFATTEEIVHLDLVHSI
jgi:hypothetical protein